MQTQTYKGYVGSYQWDNEEDIYYGKITKIDSIITFEGNTPDEIEIDFQAAVDNYIEWCLKRGKEPEKPLSIPLAVNQ